MSLFFRGVVLPASSHQAATVVGFSLRAVLEANLWTPGSVFFFLWTGSAARGKPPAAAPPKALGEGCGGLPSSLGAPWSHQSCEVMDVTLSQSQSTYELI